MSHVIFLFMEKIRHWDDKNTTFNIDFYVVNVNLINWENIMLPDKNLAGRSTRPTKTKFI